MPLIQFLKPQGFEKRKREGVGRRNVYDQVYVTMQSGKGISGDIQLGEVGYKHLTGKQSCT